MTGLDAFFSKDEFACSSVEREQTLLPLLNQLTDWHRQRCPAYGKLVALTGGTGNASELAAVPWMPVGLFKTHELKSVADDDVFKVMTSSGTRGVPSRIYLDRETAQLQSRALAHIIGSLLGKERVPMLLIDSESLLADPQALNARGAATLGMMNFARKHCFVLDQDMTLSEGRLSAFLESCGSGRFVIFGMTFMIWQYLVPALKRRQVDLSRGMLIHTGGWKKLEEIGVSNEEFKLVLKETCGLERVCNFYGMVEQVGSIFLEGNDGCLYTPSFAEVIVRDPRNWQPAPRGVVGVIQVLSVLPRSYPGHSLLTEDLGVVEGIDDSPFGWKGKRFRVLGRVPKAELRGCGDVHAYAR